MKIGIPKETLEGEKRLAGTPKTIKRLQKMDFEVLVESGAGVSAGYSDSDFTDVGAVISSDTKSLYTDSDIIIKIQPPTDEEVTFLDDTKMLACYLYPARNEELLNKLTETKASVIAMDAIPRISRAQKMDVLSTMSNITGYRAVIEAASKYGRFLNGQFTAAGKVEPAKVLVIGAGVAGLAALGAANNLGAITRAFDTRKEVEEQITSMGAEFLTVEIDEDGATSAGYSKVMSPEFIKAEMELFADQAREVDIIITTALVPGSKAPILITKDMVESMKKGSVVVDLAAHQGGNCEVSQADKTIDHNGVTVIGDLSQMPNQSSFLLGNNFAHLLDDMTKNDGFKIDLDDDIIRGAMVTHKGNLNWPPPPPRATAVAAQKTEKKVIVAPVMPEKKKSNPVIPLIFIGIFLGFLDLVAPPAFLSHFTVFVLACFIGWQVVWNVSHSLHTPLMSVTNAISGIILIGGMLHVSNDLSSPVTIIALIAIVIASINIFGGFLITHRMLKMFRK